MGEKEEGGCSVPALGENAGPVASHIQVEPWVSLGGVSVGAVRSVLLLPSRNPAGPVLDLSLDGLFHP